MILIDFHSVMISNILISLRDEPTLDEGLVRHKILYAIKKIYQKFGKEYGKIIISCDGQNYWRKTIFPYYKAKRKENMDASEIDWNAIHDYMRMIKNELREETSYPVLEVQGAESDDIIGTLVKLLACDKNKVLIVSRDKDFKQLHNEFVKQYDMIGDKFVTVDDPLLQLFEMTCRGDIADGIPNILSPGNSFVLGIRQKSLTQKKMDKWIETGNVEDEHYPRFEENQKLIDLSFIPDEIKSEILIEFEKEINKPNRKLLNYFMKYKLRSLIEDIQNF